MDLVGPGFYPLLVLILAAGLFLRALLHLLRSRFSTPTDKIVWLLVILCVPLIGPLLYFFIGTRQTSSDSSS